jgi:hypothetical protein
VKYHSGVLMRKQESFEDGWQLVDISARHVKSRNTLYTWKRRKPFTLSSLQPPASPVDLPHSLSCKRYFYTSS